MSAGTALSAMFTECRNSPHVPTMANSQRAILVAEHFSERLAAGMVPSRMSFSDAIPRSAQACGGRQNGASEAGGPSSPILVSREPMLDLIKRYFLSAQSRAQNYSDRARRR